jgi:2-polyprenyl-3-methyl-5-hydroxy-6-metoxy-1,4-benzoquinol methylase
LERAEAGASNPGRVLVRKAGSAWKRLRALVNSQRLGAAPSDIYDAEFYDEHIDSQQRESAGAVAEVLIELFSPRTSFDVGCGNGLYAGNLAQRSVRAFGCDGSIHAIQRVPEDVFGFQHDLKEPLVINRRFDLCTCFEVAEHIPKRFSENLVASCAGLSDLVVFSSAPPGQGGMDHINEQPDDFWDALFARHQLQPDTDATRRLQARFQERNVVHWLVTNTRVYRRAGE